MDEYILRTNNLSKKYKDKYILNKININVKRGDIYGLIGRNKSGKSSLFRIISGLSNASEGSIEIFKKNSANEISNERKKIGILIESPAFYDHITAYDNMELLRLQKGIPGKKCIKEKLDLVGLLYACNKKVEEFSLGMRQKLGLAMALIGDPEILILDEPTIGLDPMSVVQIREILKNLNKEKGTTIIISSHILSELYQLVNCYGIINNGILLNEITQEELYKKCKKAVEVKVDNIGKSVWILENILNVNDYKVLNNDTIKIYDYVDRPELVSRALADENISIYQIIVKGDGIEEYFMNLVEDRSKC